MRPIYESDTDLCNEQSIVVALESRFKCSFKKTPKFFSVDYVAVRENKPVAWVEIKCRKYTMLQIHSFGGYLISLKKIISAKHLFDVTGLPFILIVKAADEIYFSQFQTFSFTNLVIGGRKDRQDAEDVEPCVLIPTDSFRKL